MLLHTVAMVKTVRDKKRAKWSENDLQSAMTAVISGCSQRLAASRFNIPRRTLRNHIYSGSTGKTLGRKNVLTDEQERELTERILRYSEIGLPLTKPIVKSYVYDFCHKNKIHNPFNASKKLAGRYWLENYMKRHPEIALRKAQVMNPGRAMKLNKVIVKDYFEKLQTVMTDGEFFEQPSKIFNMDEKGCRLTMPHQQNVLAKKGSKRVHMVASEHAENVTIVACVNAVGWAIPPMIIFKGKRGKPEYSDNLPTDTLVSMSEKGCMTKELFAMWLQHFAKFKSGKVLLIFDGASSHIHPDIVDVAEDNDIVLFCLPSNTTHELQPLDKSVFRSFEHFWDLELLKYWRADPDRSLTKARFGVVCTPAYHQSFTISNIANGFRATGIYPFNPDAIPECAFAPSSVTLEDMPTHSADSSIFIEQVNGGASNDAGPSNVDLNDIEQMAVAIIASEPTIVDTNIVEPLNMDICAFEPAIAVLQPQPECASLQPLTPDVGTGITVSDQIEEIVSVVENTPTLNTSFNPISPGGRGLKMHAKFLNA